MPIRAIAFDLDDTLLRPDNTISAYTVDVLRRAHEQGMLIIPASGRTFGSMMKAVPPILALSACLCSCNGSEVWSPDGTLMMQELLPVPLAHQVAAFAAERGVYCQTYAPDRFFYTIENEWAASYAKLSSLEGECVGDLTTFITRPVTKLLMMDEPDRIARLMQEARTLFGNRASLTCSKPYFLECNPLKATKANALRWCASHFGFAMDDLVCFGDSLNDVSMLQAAGTGLCVANAREDVKALGFPVCRSNAEDGVARYIEENLL